MLNIIYMFEYFENLSINITDHWVMSAYGVDEKLVVCFIVIILLFLHSLVF